MKLEKEYPVRIRVQIQEHQGRKLVKTLTFMVYESTAVEVEKICKEAVTNEGRLMKRMWINQPSKLQPLHEYHGLNVLAAQDKNGVTIYPVTGDVISMVPPDGVLSEGWV